MSDHSFFTSSSGSDTKPKRPNRRVSLDFVKTVLVSAKSDFMPIMPSRSEEFGLDASQLAAPRRHTYNARTLNTALTTEDFDSSDDHLSIGTERDDEGKMP